MAESFAEKIRTVAFGTRGDRRRPKITTDVHEHGTVDVIEHWDGEHQDVTVKPDTIHYRLNAKETPRKDIR